MTNYIFLAPPFFPPPIVLTPACMMIPPLCPMILPPPGPMMVPPPCSVMVQPPWPMVVPPPYLQLYFPPDIYSISFYDDNIQVTVAMKASHVDQWISQIYEFHSHCRNKLVIGLDTEWLPNFAPDEDHPIAILQLCIGRHCLIFQLLHADYIPQSLHAFLGNPRHIFCGVGIQEDTKKLYEHHKLRVANIEDLNELAKLTSNKDHKEYRYMGLKRMALVYLNKEMKKLLRVTLSTWDAENLDLDQIEYAAIDAFVSFKLAFKLRSVLVIRGKMV